MLAYTVVILGAYTRLKDAGLGCPDWPTCYGQIVVPKTGTDLAQAQKIYPNQPVVSSKAWPEMVHRYFAGALVAFILTMTIWRFIRFRKTGAAIVPYFLLMGLVCFQALLGKWTVTWQLLPQVVMGHLLGGMSITAAVWWLTLDAGKLATPADNTLRYLTPWVTAGVAIVFFQIFLGGWTSANYASIICPDFPYCHGQLFPPMDFMQAFNFFHPIGLNYQGGVLDTAARITIQMSHRYGAMITATYLLILCFYLLFSKKTYVLKNTAGMILIILGTQVFLGILNIATQLSLPIALTHNAVALLLLLSMLTLLFQLVKRPIIAENHTILPETNMTSAHS